MTSLKDNLLLKKEGLELSLAETGFSFRNFLRGFPPRKKTLLLILVIALIPIVIGVRIGAQLLAQQRLSKAVIQAHTSYTAAQGPTTTPVTLLNSGRGWYSAYTQVTNENLDLAASSIPYRFDFFNATGEQVTTTQGSLYLLPNQKKYIIIPRVEAAGEQLTSAKLTFGAFQWQKRLVIPEVPLKAATPFITNELNPLTLVAEGAVVNDSPYELGTVRLVFVLYNQNDQIVAVSQRDEFNIPAFGRRAYKQTWPDLYKNEIARAQVFPDTNRADSNNLISGSNNQ